MRASETSHTKNCGFLERRPQHLILLLADWMSAIMLQAVFYGKSQFGVRQKVSQL